MDPPINKCAFENTFSCTRTKQCQRGMFNRRLVAKKVWMIESFHCFNALSIILLKRFSKVSACEMTVSVCRLGYVHFDHCTESRFGRRDTHVSLPLKMSNITAKLSNSNGLLLNSNVIEFLLRPPFIASTRQVWQVVSNQANGTLQTHSRCAALHCSVLAVFGCIQAEPVMFVAHKALPH